MEFFWISSCVASSAVYKVIPFSFHANSCLVSILMTSHLPVRSQFSKYRSNDDNGDDVGLRGRQGLSQQQTLRVHVSDLI